MFAIIQVQGNIINSLVPGEVVEVQVSIKCDMGDPQSGHWSSWTQPVQGMVPQSSGGFTRES